eukprot:CAMPEP_0197437034 /NCGR_PEP_ID=MMETSP1175-20131217/4348_1 /TAXON_ID=1003142 /ORGANISM="Triceratium dubium, Strain CCMP147" /LENGTH=422 /DNA_ID=CAMNT_0042966459 /DNA_START=12 /DNA_END=1280 /DNA_ORIENTATION=+
MKLALPSWKRSSKAASKAASKASARVGNEDTEHTNAGGDDDDVSVGSSLSSRSDDDRAGDASSFANGMIIKAIDDSVLLEQAADSLRSALGLIGEATNKRGSWIDARDLLDRTAAALDDAGLALRSRTAHSRGRPEADGSTASASSASADASKKTRKSRGSFVSIKRRSNASDDGLPATEKLVRSLADEVIEKRRSILGDALVHDADGIWTKSEYGDGDGISFGTANDALFRVPDEAKSMKSLVAWASQTGTAKKFAKRLYKDLGGDDYCVLRSMKDITVQDIAMHKRVYFVCSTFGSGRPPSEGEVFYSLAQLGASRCEENLDDLEEGDTEKPLAGTSVAVAALGSSAFNDFARFGFGLAKELTSLGASTALEIRTLDVKNGKPEQKKSFLKWKEEVINIEKERLSGWKPPKPSKKASNAA